MAAHREARFIADPVQPMVRSPFVHNPVRPLRTSGVESTQN